MNFINICNETIKFSCMKNILILLIFIFRALRGDIFEYCVGKSPFSESDAREMTRQLTAALQFIHKFGLKF